jgi:hypothetical protein
MLLSIACACLLETFACTEYILALEEVDFSFLKKDFLNFKRTIKLYVNQ